jgi:predicted AAA+ superfamily ATPase
MFTRIATLPERRSCLLLGPRQTGKSTLVRATLPKDAWTVDLLHHDTFLRFAKDPSQFRREVESRHRRGVRTVFVDEVQKVPELLDEVQSLIDSRKVRFILTGSSARKLRRGGVNLLGGRALVRRLHALTAEEMGDRFDLERVLRFGSLPQVANAADDEAPDLLAAYAQTYLREEIQAESLVRNLGGFARFLDVAAAQSGEILNAEAVARDAAVAARTVREYFQILEDTLIAFRLEAWRKSPRARLVTHPRVYLFDTGVTNALCRRLHAVPDTTTRGRLFEQWLVVECWRLVDYRHPETQLYYWRTNHGAEVDLVFERHGKLRLAVEIKSRRNVVGADTEGLRSFADAHPGVPQVVVAPVPEPFELGGIEVMPPQKFLGELGRWL